MHAEIDRETATIGVEPEFVAELVLKAIRERTFHVLTHPDMTIAAMRGRLGWLENGTAPASPMRPRAEAPPVR
jgi:hypothetical protein